MVHELSITLLRRKRGLGGIPPTPVGAVDERTCRRGAESRVPARNLRYLARGNIA